MSLGDRRQAHKALQGQGVETPGDSAHIAVVDASVRQLISGAKPRCLAGMSGRVTGIAGSGGRWSSHLPLDVTTSQLTAFRAFVPRLVDDRTGHGQTPCASLNRTLVAATRAYVEHARSSGVDVLVTDALIPFVPSFVAWGHEEAAIAQVLRDLEEAVEPTRVNVVYLRDDPEVALPRRYVRDRLRGPLRDVVPPGR